MENIFQEGLNWPTMPTDLSPADHATHKLPPGPKGIPFFGNLFQLSKTPWNEFGIWSEEYSKSTKKLFPYPSKADYSLNHRIYDVHNGSRYKNPGPELPQSCE